MSVRRLEPGEAMLFKAIRLRALADAPVAFAHTHAEMSAKSDEYWEEMTRAVTEAGRSVLFVAEEGGAPVGMAFGVLQRDDPSVPHVGGMWVDPGVRAHGVGKALTGAVVEWAVERGASRIALWVTEGNDPAIALYERMGFKATGRTVPHAANPTLRALEMERGL